MACGTVIGTGLTNAENGIEADEFSLVTQSVTVTHRKDKAEVRNRCGIISDVAYYNEHSDVEIVGFGLGTSLPAIGASITLANDFGDRIPGGVFCDEIAQERTNENFVQTTIRGTAYSGIA